jgi:hypothetical protein
MVRASRSEHVRDELRSNRRTRLVLLRLASIGITRNHSGDTTRRGGFARGDEDEEFHEVVVDVEATRLENEHIFVADGFGDFDVDLAVGKVFDYAGYEGDV